MQIGFFPLETNWSAKKYLKLQIHLHQKNNSILLELPYIFQKGTWKQQVDLALEP